MTIDLRSCSLVGSGFYADVFAVGDLAYKLFRSGPEIRPWHTNEGRRRTFECQCKAIQLAAGDQWLRRHVADFFGVCVLQDVLDNDGESIGSTYLLDCCYAIELFGPGEKDYKATETRVRNTEHIGEAFRHFDQLEIDPLDSSVFRHDDPERFKFIDILMRDCY